MRSVHSESGLLPCSHAFPDIIYNAWQATGFKLLRPEKVPGKMAALLLFSMYLLVFIYMLFWTQPTSLGSLLSFLHPCIKVRWNWGRLSTTSDCSLPHSFRYSDHLKFSRQDLRRPAESRHGWRMEQFKQLIPHDQSTQCCLFIKVTVDIFCPWGVSDSSFNCEGL